jgi:C4-dicarboxylate transporter, DctQ subunit
VKGQGTTVSLKTFNTIFDKIEDFFAVVGAVLITLAMLSVSFEVVLRFFFNRVITGMFECIEFAMLLIPLLGAAWLLRNDGHIEIDIVTSYSSPKVRAFLKLMTSALTAVICGIVTWYGVLCTWDNYRRGVQTWGALVFPKYWFIIIVPIGFLLLTIEALRKTSSSFGELQRLRYEKPWKMDV